MTTTQNQISRIAQDWSKIAKEPVKVENVSGTIYGFCSEIAALRLANKYRKFGMDILVMKSQLLEALDFCVKLLKKL